MTRHLKTMVVKETLTSTTVQFKAYYVSVGISVEVRNWTLGSIIYTISNYAMAF